MFVFPFCPIQCLFRLVLHLIGWFYLVIVNENVGVDIFYNAYKVFDGMPK